MAERLHKWDNLDSERDNGVVTVRHICNICRGVMTTTVVFDGMNPKSVNVTFEPATNGKLPCSIGSS